MERFARGEHFSLFGLFVENEENLVERTFVYADLRISGPSYRQTFVYSKHFGILKHGLNIGFGGCIRNALEDFRIQ